MNSDNLDEINNVINKLENELKPYNLTYLWHLAFNARSKWYEEGEKSNICFLNIIKGRTTQTSIEKIITEEGEVDSQEGIATLIKNFYSHIYSKKETMIKMDEDYLKITFLNCQMMIDIFWTWKLR